MSDYTIEQVCYGISAEGLDYYLRMYTGPDKLPSEIRNEAEAYIKAADAFEAKLAELGYNLEDYEM